MLAVTTYDEMCSILTESFDYWRSADDHNLKVRLCAVLIARPQTDLASREIVPEIEYFNERLGPRLHVFVAGCNRKGSTSTSNDRREIGRTGDWLYSDIDFNRFRADLESRTSWRYNDGVELLLANATRNQQSRRASIDFGTAVRIDLEKAREVGAISSVAELIGRLARYCESSENTTDPTWGFSDSMGGKIARSSIWHLFISLLPERIQNDADGARVFATVDLRAR